MKTIFMLFIFINTLISAFGQTLSKNKILGHHINLRPFLMGIEKSAYFTNNGAEDALRIYLQTGIHYQLWLLPKKPCALGFGTGVDVVRPFRTQEKNGQFVTIPVYMSFRYLSDAQHTDRYGFELQGGINLALHHPQYEGQKNNWYFYPSFLMQSALNAQQTVLFTFNLGICLQRAVYQSINSQPQWSYNLISLGGLVLELGVEF